MAVKILVFFMLGVTLVVGGISRSSRSLNAVEELKNFLEKSVNGTTQEPFNAKIGELQPEWERSGKFEGDVILTQNQQQNLVSQFLGGRNAIQNGNIWPGKTVYYAIAPRVFNFVQMMAIKTALIYISSVSCISFRPRTPSTTDYILVQGNADGCYSYIGKIGGAQVLNLTPSVLGSGCFRVATIVHEFLHALGFYHMQSTHNRDLFVQIVWNKIQPGASHNFDKYTSAQVSNLGVPYDYGSVMHYSQYAFSTDGTRTIIPLQPTNQIIGQRIQMSAGDIKKLRILYSC